MDSQPTPPAENFQAAGSKEAASNLSAAAFSNPTDFLNTLKQDLSRFSHAGNGVTLEGLESYVKNAGDDPKGQAAAAIAVKHFNDLAEWQNNAMDPDSPDNHVITPGDIKYALSLEQDHSGATARMAMLTDGLAALGSAGMAAGCGLAALSLVEAPPAAVVLAGCSGLGVAGAIASVRDMVSGTPGARAEVTHEQSMLASWPEINWTKS